MEDNALVLSGDKKRLVSGVLSGGLHYYHRDFARDILFLSNWYLLHREQLDG